MAGNGITQECPKGNEKRDVCSSSSSGVCLKLRVPCIHKAKGLEDGNEGSEGDAMIRFRRRQQKKEAKLS